MRNEMTNLISLNMSVKHQLYITVLVLSRYSSKNDCVCVNVEDQLTHTPKNSEKVCWMIVRLSTHPKVKNDS